MRESILSDRVFLFTACCEATLRAVFDEDSTLSRYREKGPAPSDLVGKPEVEFATEDVIRE